MPDDFANNTSTSGSIASGGTVTGTLEVGSDQDWFATQLTAGLLYQFDVTAASNFLNPTNIDITLIGPDGVQRSGLGPADKTLQYTPAVSGTYYVQIGSRNSNGVGNYTVSATAQDDYAGDKSTVGRVNVGGQVAGSLQPTNDEDWIAVTLAPGFNYSFIFSGGADFVNVGNAYINLRDNNGVVQAGNQLYTKGLTFTTTTGGEYYIDVGANSSASKGSYVLSVSGDDFATDATTTGALGINSTTTGTLEALGDDDWFAVTLTKGASYRFDVEPLASFTSPNSLGLVLRGVNGNRLASATVGQPATFSSPASGTYYLDVSAINATGSYRLAAANVGGTPEPSTPTPQPSVASVYRFFDTNYGTHFYTASSSERNTILATRPDLVSEGVGLSALGASTDPNVSPVYRFFDTIHGTQFVTAAATERDTVIATRSDLTYEGISFYEYNNAQPGSAPVFRFFDTTYGTHFFTGSATERATILASRPDLTPEGIAFYAPVT